MIKFLKKIRRKLLNESKFSRYLIYTVVEIILVVIGILIALQVNNWNEQRKLNKSAERSIELLYQEAQNVVSYLTKNYETSQQRVINIDKAAKALSTNSLDSSDIDSFLEGVYTTPMFEASSPPKNIYEELKNTGKFSEINSIDLKNSISDYYAQLEFFKSQLNYFRIQFVNPIEFSEGGFMYIYDDESFVKIEAWMDFEILSNNEKFKSLHVKALRDHIVISAQRKKLLEMAKIMCEKLSEELGKSCI